jgi:hypothetical protein
VLGQNTVGAHRRGGPDDDGEAAGTMGAPLEPRGLAASLGRREAAQGRELASERGLTTTTR